MTEMKDLLLDNGDCLELLDYVPSDSVDMILTDLPYGTTACSWDVIIPLEPMWEQFKRVLKDTGVIVLTASQPFTSVLVSSNVKMFRHEWIYQKRVASNFAQAKRQPLKEHESVLVFSKGSKYKYYPIKEERKGGGLSRIKSPYKTNSDKGGDFIGGIQRNNAGKQYDELKYPSTVQEFNNRAAGDRGLHPTQKPVALMEYLIKTYTDEGDTVLDATMGSGTTGVAAVRAKRKFIGFEEDINYFEMAEKRIRQELEE